MCADVREVYLLGILMLVLDEASYVWQGDNSRAA
jgi:hypothetical protein